MCICGEGVLAGKLCPDCGKFTFHKSPKGRLCSKCGYEMYIPVNDGKGGKGGKCSHCNKHKVFNNKCSGCAAEYKRAK